MRSLKLLTLLLLCISIAACELVADFDRGKLDAGRPRDAGQLPLLPEDPDATDAGPADAGLDAAQ